MTTLVAPLPGYEYEVEDEAHEAHEFEAEDEWEVSHEDEDESEEFFGALASLASRALSNPTLRRIGLSAARSALNAGGRAFSDRTGGFSQQAAGYLSGLLPQSELEAEGEDFVDPYRRVYPDRSLMEHIGHAATETEDEGEAEALISSLVPLAARAAPSLSRATPHLTNAVSAIGRQLRAQPSTRPLVRALPSIVQRTAHAVNRQAAAGQRITPQRAVRMLAQHTARTLANPRQLVKDYRHSQRLDHRHDTGVAGVPGRRPVSYHGQPGFRAPGLNQRYGLRPWGWWRGYGWPSASGYPAATPPHAHPHAHRNTPPHAPHSHATTAGPVSQAPSWHRYGPPPGVRFRPRPGAAIPPVVGPPTPGPAMSGPPVPMVGPPPAPAPYGSAGTGAWTCTCQWA